MSVIILIRTTDYVVVVQQQLPPLAGHFGLRIDFNGLSIRGTLQRPQW